MRLPGREPVPSLGQVDLLARARQRIPGRAKGREALAVGIAIVLVLDVQIERVPAAGHLRGSVGAPDRAQSAVLGAAARLRLPVTGGHRLAQALVQLEL